MLLLEAQRDPSPHSPARKQIIAFIAEKVSGMCWKVPMGHFCPWPDTT